MAKVKSAFKSTLLLTTLFQVFELSLSAATTKSPSLRTSVKTVTIPSIKAVTPSIKTERPSIKAVAPSLKAVEDPTETYKRCSDKCKKAGKNLECGENGWWFINTCHRECQGLKISPIGEDMCNPYEKVEFDRYLTCQLSCEGQVSLKECGEDGIWYDSSCRRECLGIKRVENQYCENLDKVDDCRLKCMDNGYDPICGVDGQYYDNPCHRECVGIKAGTDGVECPLKMNFGKFWSCQEKCQLQPQLAQCGQSGFWYSNKCHVDCYGDQLGEIGKDCMRPEDSY